ncbi:hypothetical protein HN954_03925 [bacterium]|jgi:hypothetical protein|nr:hypothetical protein [bacterium]MBT6831724.1 hypothetical protein [bacterium]MBT6996547.1 hypothetical protein [bacterium]MBT7772873.1 hypothetical protein [bacterium]
MFGTDRFEKREDLLQCAIDLFEQLEKLKTPEEYEVFAVKFLGQKQKKNLGEKIEQILEEIREEVEAVFVGEDKKFVIKKFFEEFKKEMQESVSVAEKSFLALKVSRLEQFQKLMKKAYEIKNTPPLFAVLDFSQTNFEDAVESAYEFVQK